jgi:hypothetical protein
MQSHEFWNDRGEGTINQAISAHLQLIVLSSGLCTGMKIP